MLYRRLSQLSFAVTALGAVAMCLYVFGQRNPAAGHDDAAAYMSKLGRELAGSVEGMTRQALHKTNRIAADPRIAELIEAADGAELTKAADRWIADSSEIDIISFFSSDGQILALNSSDHSGRAYSPERLNKLLRMDYSQTKVVQRCLLNAADEPVIEFQTKCDFTPALFDSSGLSVALSSPVADASGKRVGAVSTRINFRRILDQVVQVSYSDMGSDIYLVSGSGSYFSEEINSGKAPQPIPSEDLARLIEDLKGSGASSFSIRRADDYVGVYALDLKETMEEGKLFVVVRAPVVWVESRLQHGQMFVIPLIVVLALSLVMFAAAFVANRRKYNLTFEQGIRMGGSAVIPSLAFLALLSATLLLWRLSGVQMQQRLFMQFRHDVQEIKTRIEQEFQAYAEVLYAGEALFAASQSVDPEEWEQFFRKLDVQKRHAGLKLTRYVERAPDGALSVKYTAPPSHASDTVKDAAYLEAADRALAANSPIPVRVAAPWRDDTRDWYSMILPVIASGSPSETDAQRRSACIGYIDAVFTLGDTVTNAIRLPDRISFRIHDLDGGSAVFTSHAGRASEARADAHPLMYEDELRISCCIWKIRFESVEGYRLEAVQRNFPRIVLGGGLVVSVLVYAFLISFSTARHRALSLAQSMTQDLKKQTEIAQEARRRAEGATKTMQESEERNRLIVQTAMDGVVTFNASGMITGWNPQASAIFGWSPADILGKTFVQTLLAPANQLVFAAMISDYMKSKRAEFSRLEARALHREGFEFPVELNLCPIVLSGETMFSVFVRDITERQAAEKALRESEYRQKALLEGIPDIAWLKDQESRFIAVNPSLAKKAGLPVEQVVGKTDLDIWPRELAERYRADDREVMRLGKEKRIEEKLVGADGVEVWIETIKMPFRNDRGEVIGTAGVARDITERKRSEDELMQANTDLKRSSEALMDALSEWKKANEELRATQLQLIQVAKMESVGRLAAGVAHEVKNPLAIIQMGVDFLKTTSAQAESGSVLGDMRDAVKRADTVIRGLLDFSVSGRLESAVHDLNELIDQALVLVRHEYVKNRITVVKNYDTALPKLRLDKNKIEQVFINLFMNAIQAMEAGGSLTITTSVRKPLNGRDSGGVLCEIDDTGSGVAAEKLEKVFDPFYTTKPTGKGTGLGLTVSKKIVEMHGGTIRLSNRPEGGTRVTLMFLNEGDTEKTR